MYLRGRSMSEILDTFANAIGTLLVSLVLWALFLLFGPWGKPA